MKVSPRGDLEGVVNSQLEQSEEEHLWNPYHDGEPFPGAFPPCGASVLRTVLEGFPGNGSIRSCVGILLQVFGRTREV